jgi:histidinol-phosphatase (PHP family)
MFLADYHVHSTKSFDAEPGASIENILRTAAENNINQVALTDHYDVNWILAGDINNPEVDFKDSREQIIQAKRLIRCDTELLLGVELGQPHQSPETDAHAEKLLRENDFDYILCALHNNRGEADFYFMDYSDPDKAKLEKMFERYSRELCELAEWRSFHAVAHADYPVRYFKSNQIDIDARKYYDLYKDFFKIIIRRGIALEINTSGLRREHFEETMPSFDLLKIYKDMGGELLTMGSDSHSAGQLGDILERFNLVYAKLLELGFKYISIVKNKKFEQIKIEI